REVDDKLIALAKQYGAMLYTTDYNLNKVAQIEGVTVLNVNELAQALRPPRLPGERLEIKITQVGQDKTQGVGYLEDGTMVVVEGASKLLGKKVLVQFSRMLQTQAGKMMFGVLPSGGEAHHAHPHQQPQHTPQAQPVKKVQPQGSFYHSELHKHHAQPRPAPHKKPAAAATPSMTPMPSKPKNKWPAKRKKSAEDSLIAAVQNQK
ncbi:MAG TPA: TRAM domain-containing protein, partial [Candidatus Saccharimonadales bacterium]|nr:TRAM domain-containing protein [Candidatus Saccharimonadales bacterium]